MNAGGPEWTWPRWIAHRGGGCAAPENTLGGVALAARRGFDAVEVDVRLSGDGLPVVIHDETLLRTTGRPGQVSGYTAFDLTRMRASIGFEDGEWRDETIPDLGMLLVVAAHHRLRVNLELKGGPESPAELVEAVAVALDQLSWAMPPGNLLISAFDPEVLLVARLRLRAIARAFLCERAGTAEISAANALRCSAINIGAVGCSAAAVAAARTAGLAVGVWTVNDHSEAEALFALGVTSVFTDLVA